jgi:predicted glutamine amidotransferase
MCRLFGLSAAPHRVGASFWLLEAPDSLLAQSRLNPDGTGLGYFDRDGDPVLDNRVCRPGLHQGGETGVIQGLDRLEQQVGDEMRLVHGDTDSERYLALVTKEIRSHGDVVAGIASAVRWIAASLPLSSLNFVLATRDELWALRYPESHRLYILEREAGGRHGGRALHHASSTLRVHVPPLAEHPSVVVASEPLDDSPDWRLLHAGELARVSSNLTVASSALLERAPAQLVHVNDPSDRSTTA